MSGMHLMPVYYTDTNLKKRKSRKVIPTSDKVGNGLKKSKPLYTGSAVIGQAYNKGGLQVLSTEEINDPMTGKRR